MNMNKIKPEYNLIVAYCKNRGIGYNGALPWCFKSDMKHFTKLTIGGSEERNAVVMGRNTLSSIPFKKFPLIGRDNYCLSRMETSDIMINYKQFIKDKNITNNCDNVFFFNNPINMINTIESKDIYNKVWIIGGESIYKYFLMNDMLDNLYITYIHQDYLCDRFFPDIEEFNNYKIVERSYNFEKNVLLEFQKYSRC